MATDGEKAMSSRVRADDVVMTGFKSVASIPTSRIPPMDIFGIQETKRCVS